MRFVLPGPGGSLRLWTRNIRSVKALRGSRPDLPWGEAMLIQDPAKAVRVIESDDDLAETRLEALGFLFHGHLPQPDAKRPARTATNTLHFARCAKLEKIGDTESKVWFRTIGAAKTYLDAQVGAGRWKWCKVCEREITQKILNEQ